MSQIIAYAFIFAVLMGLPFTTICQNNFGKEWVIGYGGYMIKFDNQITHDTTHKIAYFNRGSSNICDSNGNIILASNGMNVYDRNGNWIDAGDTLIPKDWYNFEQGSSTYSQSSIFLPMDNKKYYFITPTMNDTMLYNCLNVHGWKFPFNLLLYSVIDMNANAGAGKVIKRMQPIIKNEELLKVGMQACRHPNGKDWWLLKQAGDSTNGNRVFKFLFTQDSVYNYGVQIIPYPFRGYYDVQGQMVFTKDGSKWASTYCAFPSTGEVFIADFDRCTGMLSNFSTISVGGQVTGFPVGDVQSDTSNVGICFSPKGQHLYISRYSHVMQYQFVNNAFHKVCGMDTVYDHFAGYTNLGLGEDGKIYIGHFHGTSKQMSVIDNPNGQGAACNFCRKCLRSKNPETMFGLLSNPPTMPNYELGEDLPCWPVSNEEVALKEEFFLVYPNPSTGMFYIKTESKVKKELYNAVEQRLISTSENQMNISYYTKGVYYIKCGNAVRKIIVE